MKKAPTIILFLLFLLIGGSTVFGQQNSDVARDRTREQMRTLLDKVGSRRDINVAFRQSDKQPYNFVGVMKDGLTNCDMLEIVIGISKDQTIGFRVYPHYNGAYINADKVRNEIGLMRKLLQLTDANFLFWGMDSTADVFAGYTFTLESGFPEEAVTIVLSSIKNTDKYVGEMRPVIDGTSAP